MESHPDSSPQQQIHNLLRQGDLQAARNLAYHWLNSWTQSRPSNPSRANLRNPALWQSLADVIEHTHDDYLAERFWQSLDAIAPPISVSSQSIPLLGIPTLNRVDLLQQLLNSLDYPVDTLAIVDNSVGAENQAKLAPQLNAIQQTGHPKIGKIEVAKPFRNLGVAASWNLILTSFPDASWTLLANNDIQFAPGVLAAAAASIDPSRSQFISLLPDPQSFSAFLITAKTWDQIGLFDPSFYPAYCEDLDYRDRLRADPTVTIIQNRELQGAMASLNQQHSATIGSDPKLAAHNLCSFQLNRIWYLSQRRIRKDPRGSWIRRWLGSWDL